MSISLDKLARKKTLRVAGLMSGTSADGVDSAIVDITGGGVKLLAFDCYLYSAPLRRRIFELFDKPAPADICRMNFVLGELFASAVCRLADRSGLGLESIDLIGSHGQTIYHSPKPAASRLPGWAKGKNCRTSTGSTLQIGESSVIAERTGITVVSDFRTRDIAAGGQGAPLVPYADFVLFGHARKSRVVLNIGGIANVTYIPAGGQAGKVVAFDTGPGNMIIDHLVRRLTGGRLTYDRDGLLAAAGRVNDRLIGELMRHRYLRRRPPKSTGREQFGSGLADELLERARLLKISKHDLIATAAAYSADSIVDACRRWLGPIDEMIVCGGGARNPVLVAMLTERMAPVPVVVMDELGINADAKEAVSFAILAARTIRGKFGNVPSATGAEKPVVLGKITPG